MDLSYSDIQIRVEPQSVSYERNELWRIGAFEIKADSKYLIGNRDDAAGRTYVA